ncbi:MAG: hypothetical protein KDI05_10125 [Halieaceae bacterium]|nr:hypothetical protein [Halieaceae bacterium]MCP5163818.1 hypothetical protein [Pseudomonadales bacterium]MCP5202868.1 hypothetical protein [Pseudomonadales bacterium]
MKLQQAIELGKEGRWLGAQVRVNPGSRGHWFVMLQDTRHKSFVLADEEDQPITCEDINVLARHIRSIGLKEFTVFL